ncbi:MAG: hypothetical protein ACJA2S_002208 [Cyclobacteriaceae bacterium]|jgi:hypothetical protein
MKLFVKKIFLFVFIISISIFAILGVYFFQIRDQLILSKNITTVILGNSHTQNGLNDQIISNSVNLSSSAESYLYSYAKLKYLVQHNPSITNVILSFSKVVISENITRIWLFNENNVFGKFGSLYPILNVSDLEYLINEGKINLALKALNGAIYHSFYSIEKRIILRSPPFIGGYTPNSRNMLQSEINTSINDSVSEYSIDQTVYLEKIKILCEKHSLNLILINTPTYGKKMKEKVNLNFFTYESPIYLDYSIMNLNETFFADPRHLNPKGADTLSVIVDLELKKFLK